MIRRNLSAFLFLIIMQCSGNAQFSVKLQTGISYIEHFSTGITFCFSDKHNLSVLYGSNLFIKPLEFSNVLLQYDFLVNRINLAGITPGIGIKTGYSLYTNKYYKWHLISTVPFIRLNHKLSNTFELNLDLGTVITYEFAVKRISYNEIGMYRTYLPEIKLCLVYKL
jgi:hypothetical protein